MSRTPRERAALRQRCRKVAAGSIGVVSVLALTGCSQETTDELKRLGLPEAGSDRSPYISDLWLGSWIACLVVGVLVWGLIAYVIIRYRRRRLDEIPRQVRYHLPIEMLYTVTPLIVVAAFFYFTIEAQDKVLADVAHPNHQVLVTAQQWSWTFSYLDEGAVGGTDVYDVGTPAIEPELWLVKDQSVNFDLHSPDVIHSFWVPAFYFKMDVIPGRENSFSMTPTRLGTFQGRCAELCGVLHSRMLFQVHVVTQAEFDAHLKALKRSGQIGAPRGGVNSRTLDSIEPSQQSGGEG